jgi:hypothetical protein
MAKLRKVSVSECPSWAIVCFQGDWGVLSGRELDRWNGCRIKLRGHDIVQILEQPKPPKRKTY